MKTIKPVKTVQTPIKNLLLTVFAVVTVGGVARGEDTYTWSNLQSDVAGVADGGVEGGGDVDPNLVNPWGMAASTGGPIWRSDNGTGVATLFNDQDDNTANPLVVAIPGKADHKPGNPTGVVSNSTAFFTVSKNGTSQPSRFIFVSEDGTISGWNPALDRTHAFVAVKGQGDNVYKGATLGVANGHNFLYVTNFHKAKVETYDESFHRVNPNGFRDPNIPHKFAPFGIRNFNGQIYVTYAKQAPGAHDDEAGPGNGFIDVFDTSGNRIGPLISNGELDSPWGLALIEGELWVGNFGDGKINKYDPKTGVFVGTINRADGTPLQFDGLWDMLPLGDGVYFTAGIADEEHGLFGIITKDPPSN
jgi:uncharacterized protein (TIGR03118 family)